MKSGKKIFTLEYLTINIYFYFKKWNCNINLIHISGKLKINQENTINNILVAICYLFLIRKTSNVYISLQAWIKILIEN